MDFLQWLHLGCVAALIATIAWSAAHIGGAVRHDRYQPPRARFR